MLIDAHQHFWQVGLFDYPWMTSDLGVLYRDYLPETFEPILKQNNVAGTVLVQASNSLAESHWLLGLADANSFIKGVVGWVDLSSPNVDQQLRQLSLHPLFKGVRHLVESEPDDDWLAQPEVLHGLKRLSAYGLSYDLLVHPRHLKYVATVAEACPDLKLIIDHLAKPAIAKREINGWAVDLKSLSVYPNLHCKLSGLVTEADWKSWTNDDLRPYIDVALEAFGSERVIFGSDYPVCLLAATYEQVIEATQESLSTLSEEDRQRIFSLNAAAFYGLN